MPWICCQLQLTDDVGSCPTCKGSKQKWTMRLGRKTNRLVVGREKPKTLVKLAVFRGMLARPLEAWSSIVEDANGGQLVTTPRAPALDGKVAVKLLGAEKARAVRLYLGEDPERATDGLVLVLDTPGSDLSPKVMTNRLRNVGLWARPALESAGGTQASLELDLALARLRRAEGDAVVPAADGAKDLAESYDEYVPARAVLPRVAFDDAVDVVTVASLLVLRGRGTRRGPWMVAVEDQAGAELARSRSILGAVEVRAPRWAAGHVVRARVWAEEEEPEDTAPAEGFVLDLVTPSRDAAPNVVTPRLRSLGLWGKAPLAEKLELKESQQRLEVDLALFRHLRLNPQARPGPLTAPNAARHAKDYFNYTYRREKLPTVKFDDQVEVVVVGRVGLFRGAAARRDLGACHVAVEDAGGAELARSQVDVGSTVEVKVPAWAAPHAARARLSTVSDHEGALPSGLVIGLAPQAKDDAPDVATHRLRNLGLWGKAPLPADADLKESQKRLEVDLALARQQRTLPDVVATALDATTAGALARAYLGDYRPARAKLPTVKFEERLEVVVVGRVALFRGDARRRALGACHVAVEDAGGAELARSQVDVGSTVEVKVPAWAAPHAARARLSTVSDHEGALPSGLVIGLAPQAKDDAPDVATHRLRNLGLWGKAPLPADADLKESQKRLEVDLALARQQRTLPDVVATALDATTAGALARAYLGDYRPARAKLPAVKFDAKLEVAVIARLAVFRGPGARDLGACVVAVDDASGAELARSYVDLGSAFDVKLPAWAAPHAARIRLWTAGGEWGLVMTLAPHANDAALDVGTARLRSLGAWTRAPLAADAQASTQTTLELDLALSRHLRSQAQAVQPFADGAGALARLYLQHPGRGRTTLARPTL